jgi:hypothetical protein
VAHTDMLRLLDGTKLPEEAVLGVITIFTVPDKNVDGAVLANEWAREGLDPKLIPDTRRPVNDFQQACRSVETRRAGTNAQGHKTEVKVDEVTNAGDECVYQITRMIRDTTNRVIDHPKAMRVIFNKVSAETNPDSANCIRVEPLDPAHFGAIKGLADRIVQHYDSNRGTVPGQKVRNAVRDYMKILGAENLRRASGGVYFVPMVGADTLKSLARVCETIYPDGDCDFAFFPQPNTKAAAKLIAKHHVLNVQSEADEMMSRISERLKNGTGKVRKDLLTNLMQQRRELGAHRKRYIELLGGEQKLITEKMSMLDEMLENLMERAV